MIQDIPAFTDALISDDEARQTFTWMGTDNQDAFLNWIKSALTKSEARQRIQAVVDMLAGREAVRHN